MRICPLVVPGAGGKTEFFVVVGVSKQQDCFCYEKICLKSSFIIRNKVDRETLSWRDAFINDVIAPCETKVWTCSIFSGDRLRGSTRCSLLSKDTVVLFKTWIYSWKEMGETFACVSSSYLAIEEEFSSYWCRWGVPAESVYYKSFMFCSKFSHFS